MDASEHSVPTPPVPRYQAMRVETGFAVNIMRLSALAAMVTSPCWAGNRCAVSVGRDGLRRGS